MRNERGEVITGVMVVIMVAVMIFGGMHMGHGGHHSNGDHQQMEQKHNHDEGHMHHMHDHTDGHNTNSGQDDAK